MKLVNRTSSCVPFSAFFVATLIYVTSPAAFGAQQVELAHYPFEGNLNNVAGTEDLLDFAGNISFSLETAGSSDARAASVRLEAGDDRLSLVTDELPVRSGDVLDLRIMIRIETPIRDGRNLTLLSLHEVLNRHEPIIVLSHQEQLFQRFVTARRWHELTVSFQDSFILVALDGRFIHRVERPRTPRGLIYEHEIVLGNVFGYVDDISLRYVASPTNPPITAGTDLATPLPLRPILSAAPSLPPARIVDDRPTTVVEEKPSEKKPVESTKVTPIVKSTPNASPARRPVAKPRYVRISIGKNSTVGPVIETFQGGDEVSRHEADQAAKTRTESNHSTHSRTATAQAPEHNDRVSTTKRANERAPSGERTSLYKKRSDAEQLTDRFNAVLDSLDLSDPTEREDPEVFKPEPIAVSAQPRSLPEQPPVPALLPQTPPKPVVSIQNGAPKLNVTQTISDFQRVNVDLSDDFDVVSWFQFDKDSYDSRSNASPAELHAGAYMDRSYFVWPGGEEKAAIRFTQFGDALSANLSAVSVLRPSGTDKISIEAMIFAEQWSLNGQTATRLLGLVSQPGTELSLVSEGDFLAVQAGGFRTSNDLSIKNAMAPGHWHHVKLVLSRTTWSIQVNGHTLQSGDMIHEGLDFWSPDNTITVIAGGYRGWIDDIVVRSTSGKTLANQP